MALNGNEVYIANTGHFYTEAVGAAKPSGLPETGANESALTWTPTATWVEVGHTARDTPFAINRDGGDRTTNGSWQAPNLDESVAPTTWSLGFSIIQQDAEALKLYYGGGTVDAVTDSPTLGDFLVPFAPAAQQRAMLMQVIHSSGTRAKWYYFPKVSILGSDNSEGATDDYQPLPVSATILDARGDVEDLAGLFAISLQTA